MWSQAYFGRDLYDSFVIFWKDFKLSFRIRRSLFRMSDALRLPVINAYQ